MQRKRKDFSFFLISIFFCTQITFAQEPDNKELNNLEEKIFRQNYSSESKEARAERLENFLFGKPTSKETIENRIKKITTALKAPETEQLVEKEIKSETLDKIPLLQVPANNEGIIGAISQIEIKMFNMTFNEYPFVARINALEDRLLSKQEIATDRIKPLLERVTILVKKAGITQNSGTGIQDPANSQKPTANSGPRSYSIDPNTGLLINDQTGETVKDNTGQPISVMLPQAIPQQILPQLNYRYQPQQQNPLYQNSSYGNQFLPNRGGIPSPYDFLFNQQNNLDPGGSDLEY